MPLRGRALVLRTEPRRSRVSALPGFDPHRGRPAGLTPVRRPPVARSTRNRREREHALPEVSDAGDADPSRFAPAADPRPALRRRCEGAPGMGRSPALADQRGVRAGRWIVVPDELPREHHALDAAAVGEHGAEDCWQPG